MTSICETFAADMRVLRSSQQMEDAITSLMAENYWTVAECCEYIRGSMWDATEADGGIVRLSWLPLRHQYSVVRTVLNRMTNDGRLSRALGSQGGREVLAWNACN